MYKLTLGLKLDESGGAGGIGGARSNICVKIGDNAASTLRGMHPTLITANVGEVVPEYTAGGILIYSLYWDTTTGKFIMQFGDAGNEKLPNTVQILAEGTNKLVLQYDEVEQYYTTTDKDVADSIITPVGDVLCFMFYVVPDLMIHYKYIELQREGDLGDEIFTNSEFETDVAGWSLQEGILSEHSTSAGGCLKLIWDTTTGWAYQTITNMIIGREYVFTASVFNLVNGATAKTYNTDTQVLSELVSDGEEPAEIITNFVATQQTTTFRVYVGNAAGAEAYYSKVSLKQKL